MYVKVILEGKRIVFLLSKEPFLEGRGGGV